MTGIYDEMKSCNLSGAAVYAAADDLDTDILRCKNAGLFAYYDRV